MTVRVSRTFAFDAEPEAVWAFIADPEQRASAISVVEDYEVREDGTATWHVALPVPVLDSTVAVETEEVERDPPRCVEFVGRSRAVTVRGTHTVEPTETGCRLVNEFVLEGKLPGVERFFRRNLDAELDNLEQRLREHLGLTA